MKNYQLAALYYCLFTVGASLPGKAMCPQLKTDEDRNNFIVALKMATDVEDIKSFEFADRSWMIDPESWQLLTQTNIEPNDCSRLIKIDFLHSKTYEWNTVCTYYQIRSPQWFTRTFVIMPLLENN